MIDLQSIDQDDPFEIDAANRPHLAKHPHLSEDDVYDVFLSDPVFAPARPPAELLMIGNAGGTVYTVPLVAGRRPDQLRPIGIYRASAAAEEAYRRG